MYNEQSVNEGNLPELLLFKTDDENRNLKEDIQTHYKNIHKLEDTHRNSEHL